MPKGIYKNPIERSKKISEKLKKGILSNCLNCNKEIYRRPYEIKNNDKLFCSRLCFWEWQKGKTKNKYNKDQTGCKNPNWKGGISSLNNKIRTSPEYKEWKQNIFERDNWTCQKCKNRSSKNNNLILHAHHIKPFALFPELRFDINNGITLCKECHNKEPKGRQINAL